jgi:hypothetical protein
LIARFVRSAAVGAWMNQELACLKAER